MGNQAKKTQIAWKPSSNLDRDFPLEHPNSEGSKNDHISTTNSPIGWKPSATLDRDFPLEATNSEGSKKKHISTTEYTFQASLIHLYTGAGRYTRCALC
jgi:hypothetical protein